ncbi:MAG: hypothetical protein PHG24_01420 [Candidatus Pacebacteria bacterium]|nr:hypothetical protein [Candidatus Paceibacterota bacterium]
MSDLTEIKDSLDSILEQLKVVPYKELSSGKISQDLESVKEIKAKAEKTIEELTKLSNISKAKDCLFQLKMGNCGISVYNSFTSLASFYKIPFDKLGTSKEEVAKLYKEVCLFEAKVCLKNLREGVEVKVDTLVTSMCKYLDLIGASLEEINTSDEEINFFYRIENIRRILKIIDKLKQNPNVSFISLIKEDMEKYNISFEDLEIEEQEFLEIIKKVYIINAKHDLENMQESLNPYYYIVCIKEYLENGLSLEDIGFSEQEFNNYYHEQSILSAKRCFKDLQKDKNNLFFVENFFDCLIDNDLSFEDIGMNVKEVCEGISLSKKESYLKDLQLRDSILILKTKEDKKSSELVARYYLSLLLRRYDFVREYELRKYLEKADLSLEEIGTSEKQLKEMKKKAIR